MRHASRLGWLVSLFVGSLVACSSGGSDDSAVNGTSGSRNGSFAGSASGGSNAGGSASNVAGTGTSAAGSVSAAGSISAGGSSNGSAGSAGFGNSSGGSGTGLGGSGFGGSFGTSGSSNGGTPGAGGSNGGNSGVAGMSTGGSGPSAGTTGSAGSGQGGSGNTTAPERSGMPIPPTNNVAKPAGTAGNLSVLNWAGFKSAVTFTFDDALSSQISNYAALHAPGVPLTFYLVSNNNPTSATWTQAAKDGNELGNHTAHHCHDDGTGCAWGTYAGNL
ncbi:MAG TPA: polysaccharide deacetylase family protein, partial [Polyangiaceae bacterium]|nr:polysaccharide deacetylase family protein [Polyangiaceae bacterium]